jgi:hypothetical protein
MNEISCPLNGLPLGPITVATTDAGPLQALVVATKGELGK